MPSKNNSETDGVDDVPFRIQDHRDLERLDIAIPEALRNAAENLVCSKYVLDKVVGKNHAPCLQSELSRGHFFGPCEGPDFFRSVFPFVPMWGGGSDFAALVPTSLTLGCSWRWRGEHLSERERQNYFDRFTDPPPNSLSTHTGYLWIRPLGLLLPCEGKNRVDFLREENVDWFPASVTESDYPDAARLVLYSVNVHGQEQCWAVLDGRWVERVAHPDWALPVLRAYGVLVEQKWPYSFPSVQDVAAGFDRPDGLPNFLNHSVVDLDRVAKERASQNALVACTYMELRGIVRLKSYAIVGWWLGILIVSLLVSSYLLRSWDWSVALAIMTGVGLGATLLPFILLDRPIFQTTRAMTSQHWQHD